MNDPYQMSEDDLLQYWKNTVCSRKDKEGLYFVRGSYKDGDGNLMAALTKVTGGIAEEYAACEDLLPWWPASGYYTTYCNSYTEQGVVPTSFVVNLQGVAKRQWKQSYCSSLYKTTAPNAIDMGLLNVDTSVECMGTTFVRTVYDNTHSTWQEILDCISEPRCYGLTISNDIAVLKYIYMAYPIVVFQDMPIGWVSGSGITLSKEFDYLIELVSQYAPTMVEEDL